MNGLQTLDPTLFCRKIQVSLERPDSIEIIYTDLIFCSFINVLLGVFALSQFGGTFIYQVEMALCIQESTSPSLLGILTRIWLLSSFLTGLFTKAFEAGTRS